MLRDIQERPMEMLRHRDQDVLRLALFPNLDYVGLHKSLVALVDIMPLIQSGTQGKLMQWNICLMYQITWFVCVELI